MYHHQIVLIILLATAHIAIALPAFSPRVVNGTDAKIEDFPWIVSLESYGSHNCGGSLIADAWILTASHCRGVNRVRYGTDDLRAGHVVGIKQFISHRNYSSSKIRNDIALIRLESSIVFSDAVKAVKLPTPFYEVPGNWKETATLVGFGLEASGGSVQDHLQEVELRVASNKYCKKVHNREVFESNICAGVPEGGKGQCSGDSGGPLTLAGGEQIGIVSWSEKPCTVAPYPGVYTKVSHYIDWIEETTGLKFH